MSEHYFSNTPQSKSSPNEWTFTLRNKTYHFKSDVGVFSKKRVDFGTVLLIENFRAPEIQGSYLDLGCGYGPIGMSISEDGRPVVMVDINERAVSLAKENLELNQISNCEVKISDGFSAIANQSFAAIVSNPPIRTGKAKLYELLEQAREALVKQGELWLVIQKKQGALSAINKLNELFGHVETVAKKKGYFILRAVNV